MSGTLFDGLVPEPRQKSSDWFTAHCDGGSRGNPGPAGYGAVIEDPQGRIVARLSEFLGSQTNNYAEYAGLLGALKWAVEYGAPRLRVVSDSLLMVRQMNGQYRMKNPGLQPLWMEARQLARQLAGFEITHTLRAGNTEADRLANAAMDRGMGKSRDQGNKAPREQAIPRPSNHADNGPQFANPQAPKTPRQVLEGYVKDGVVHLLEGELPDGIFVKVVRD